MNTGRLRPLFGLASLLAILVLVASCGINNDSSPRDINGDDPSLLNLVTAKPAGASAGSGPVRIFVLAPETSGAQQRLRASTRDVGDSPAARLSSLLGPLTVADTGDRLRTAVPEGLELNAAVVQSNGTAVIDVTNELLALPRSVLVDAVSQIVFTVAEVQGVTSVELRVEGRSLQWPTGDGELRSEPLTVYDFPGFIESTQPNFPAVPSPGDA